MPSILRIGPYRLFFYSSDGSEPLHVHIEREDKVAKFWIEPIRLQKSGGFSRSEIARLHKIIKKNSATIKERPGMSISAIEISVPFGVDLGFSENTLSVELSDGRTISVPLDWFPRLLHGTESEKNSWKFIGRGEGIHWPDLDEDISIEGLLLGQASNESPKSLKRWLDQR